METFKENIFWTSSKYTNWGARSLPTWEWASPGYRYTNLWAAGILNNEQLPSVLSRAETKTWFRGTQTELLSSFKLSHSGRAVSCSSGSGKDQSSQKQSCSSPQAANTKSSALISCPALWHWDPSRSNALDMYSLPWTQYQEEGNVRHMRHVISQPTVLRNHFWNWIFKREVMAHLWVMKIS